MGDKIKRKKKKHRVESSREITSNTDLCLRPPVINVIFVIGNVHTYAGGSLQFIDEKLQIPMSIR